MTTDEKIEDLRVRVAIAEHSLGAIHTQLGRVEAEILEHRRSSTQAHTETAAAIRAASESTIRLDAGSARWLGALLAALIASLVGGGVVVGRTASPVVAADPSAAVQAPAP